MDQWQMKSKENLQRLMIQIKKKNKEEDGSEKKKKKNVKPTS